MICSADNRFNLFAKVFPLLFVIEITPPFEFVCSVNSTDFAIFSVEVSPFVFVSSSQTLPRATHSLQREGGLN